MKKKVLSNKRKFQKKVTPDILRNISIAMLPFYRALAFNKRFAIQVSRAVVNADLDRLKQLLCSVAPIAAKQGLATNGIGYFISFPTRLPSLYYTNGTTIPPGTVQFTFEARVQQALARAVLPLYRELAHNPGFASALAKAINQNEQRVVAMMVRSLVRTRALQSVRVESGGIVLPFKFRFSKFIYVNLLIQDF